MKSIPIYIERSKLVTVPGQDVNLSSTEVIQSRLVESDKVDKELLISTMCRYDTDSINKLDYICQELLPDSPDNLFQYIKSNLVYQGTKPDPSDLTYDYYVNLDGSIVIPLIVEPDVVSIDLVFSDNSKKNIELTNSDCYRLVIISSTDSDDFNVITKVHQLSSKPHVNYFTDIMRNNELGKIRTRYMYNQLTDVRNNNLLGSKLSNSTVWQ